MPDDFLAVAKEVNNWGRWGAEDERGTLNLITPDLVRAAMQEVQTGERVSLAIPLSERGPQIGNIPGRINPLRTMTAVNEPALGDPALYSWSEDVVTMSLQAGTHWDALTHVSYDGRIWNGFPASTIDTHGASRAGIDKTGPIAGRGVLLDVARARGVDHLEGGDVVTADDLDAAAALGGVTIQAGDIALIRTGWIQHFLGGDRRTYSLRAPGPGMQTVRWFRDHDVAAAATDTLAFEVFPFEREDCILPVHLLNLVEMGLTQGQNFDLEGLSARCADDGRYTFFLGAAPEPFARGLGGPVHPFAIR